METFLQELVDAATAQYAGYDALDQARLQRQRMAELSANYIRDHLHDESTISEMRDTIRIVNVAWDYVHDELTQKKIDCPFVPGYCLNSMLTMEHPNIFRTLFA